MSLAADAEDKTEKHPVTPGVATPARELYGVMLLERGMAKEALGAFETTLRKEPNRFGAYAGAAKAAENSGAKAETIAKARDILTAGVNPDAAEIEDVATAYAHLCACCGGRMMIVELFEPGSQPRYRPPRIRIDTS